jgi:transcriptional regulator with XRE-family HTH domain
MGESLGTESIKQQVSVKCARPSAPSACAVPTRPHGTEEEERPMYAPASPMVRRRRLAAELRGIREGKGKSGEAVAAALRWSPSKISRYERARTGLRPREVERLLDYYQITGSRRDLLLGLAEDAAQKGWWEELADSLPEDYQQFIALEHEAASMAIWHVDAVAGLLQTQGYARHIISSYSRVEPVTPGMIGRMVSVRMRRQQVLDRAGLQLSVVLDESVLKRRIGDDTVMYEQLQHLARAADRPNLTLQILPLDTQHTVFGESFVIFGFGADSDAILQDVVTAEHLKSSCVLEGERDTYLYRIAFQTLSEASLDPAASKALILETAESYWSGAWRRASA